MSPERKPHCFSGLGRGNRPPAHEVLAARASLLFWNPPGSFSSLHLCPCCAPACEVLPPPPRVSESPQFRKLGCKEGRRLGSPWGLGVGRPQAEAGALNTVTSPSWCTGRGLVLTLTPSGPKSLPHAPGLGRGYAAPGLGWSPSSLPTLLRLQADSRCTLSLSFPIRKMGGHSDGHRVGSHSFGLHPSASLH